MKLLNRIHFAAAALAAVLLAAPLAHAGGIYDQYPAGPSPTGAESFAADTNLSGGRNPQTGATIEIAASSVPKFTAGATLKAAVNK